VYSAWREVSPRFGAARPAHKHRINIATPALITSGGRSAWLRRTYPCGYPSYLTSASPARGRRAVCIHQQNGWRHGNGFPRPSGVWALLVITVNNRLYYRATVINCLGSALNNPNHLITTRKLITVALGSAINNQTVLDLPSREQHRPRVGAMFFFFFF
jgi:hypothetical protein